MRIGIDLGGTKTEAIALDDDSTVAARRRVATPRNYSGTLDAIARLVAEVEAEAGRTGPIGVGIPGVVSRATGLSRTPTPPGSTAGRSPPTSRPAWAARCGLPTTPTASPSPKPMTAPARASRPCSA